MDFPLESIHARAFKAAEATQCALDQGKFWEMHDRLFANQQALAEPALKQHARALGLDGAKFDRCLDSGSMASALEASRKLGESLGLNATPTFYVNGRPVSGNLAFERFQELVDWELKNPGK